MKEATLSNKLVILIFVFLFTGACAGALLFIRSSGENSAKHEIRDPFAAAAEPIEATVNNY